MRIIDLLFEQRISIQMVMGEQKIEFQSIVLEKNDTEAFVSPYVHNGTALQLNISMDSGVVCNVFADDMTTHQRVSWKNIELKTVERDDGIQYSLKTSQFNNIARQDDRRMNERIVIQKPGHVFDGSSENGVQVLIHDISDVGVSFFVSEKYDPKSPQLVVRIKDMIDDKKFDLKVNCTISRTSSCAGSMLYGCRVLGDNRDYQLYRFLKVLKSRQREKNGQ